MNEPTDEETTIKGVNDRDLEVECSSKDRRSNLLLEVYAVEDAEIPSQIYNKEIVLEQSVEEIAVEEPASITSSHDTSTAGIFITYLNLSHVIFLTIWYYIVSTCL